MELGQLGIWANLDSGVRGLAGGSASALATAQDNSLLAQRVEGLGYSALWMPEGFGRNPLVHAGWLLAKVLSNLTRNWFVTPAGRPIEAQMTDFC